MHMYMVSRYIASLPLPIKISKSHWCILRISCSHARVSFWAACHCTVGRWRGRSSPPFLDLAFPLPWPGRRKPVFNLAFLGVAWPAASSQLKPCKPTSCCFLSASPLFCCRHALSASRGRRGRCIAGLEKALFFLKSP